MMVYRRRFRGSLFAILAGVVLILGCEAYLLWQIREERWHSAEQSAENILNTLSSAINRNLRVVDLSLGGVQDALEHRDLSGMDSDTRNMLLFDRSGNAEYLGSMLVLTPAGDILFDSGSAIPRKGNFSDRDYFKAQIDRQGFTFLSRPYESRLRAGDPSIALSRRITGPDGRFEGVVMGDIRLVYFKDLFSQVHLGSKGTISLISFDGRVLMRSPSTNGSGDVDFDVSNSPVFQHMKSGPVRFFTAKASIDGVRRHYVYDRVGNYPLVLTVAFAVDDVFREWRIQAAAFAALGLLVSAAILLLALALQRAVTREKRMKTEMEVLATTDALTGLANRRHFEHVLAKEWSRAARQREPLSLLVIDIDHFKAVNDRFGHATGDDLLREVAVQIRNAIRRPDDLAARYGGEEFAALLPNTDETGARLIAERIRLAVAEAGCPDRAGGHVRATVSIGISTMLATPSAPLDELFRLADKALYRAKDGGRNQTMLLNDTSLDP